MSSVPPCLFLLATDATTGPPLFFLAEIRHSELVAGPPFLLRHGRCRPDLASLHHGRHRARRLLVARSRILLSSVPSPSRPSPLPLRAAAGHLPRAAPSPMVAASPPPRLRPSLTPKSSLHGAACCRPSSERRPPKVPQLVASSPSPTNLPSPSFSATPHHDSELIAAIAKPPNRRLLCSSLAARMTAPGFLPPSMRQ